MLRALAEYNTSIVHQMNFPCTSWAVQQVYITNLIEQPSTWIDVTDATTLELEATSIPVRWETYSCHFAVHAGFFWRLNQEELHI